MNSKMIADGLAVNIAFGLRNGYVLSEDLGELFFEASLQNSASEALDNLFVAHLNLLHSRMEGHERGAKKRKGAAA